MLFNKHLSLVGTHALFSASNYHWINYDEEKVDRFVLAAAAARRGSELHDLAAQLIRLGVKLPATRQSLNMYVNDAIGFGMTPEQLLFFSENFYGTADSIGFRRNKLRIHDLKTGMVDGSVHQEEVYAALFCLEYGVSPLSIEMEFRIYQHDDVAIFDGDPDVIMHIMDKIKVFDKRIKAIRLEAQR